MTFLPLLFVDLVIDITGSITDEGTKNGHKPRHQAVLALDMKEWQELIESFDIKTPMIKHREEENPGAVPKKGWYA